MFKIFKNFYKKPETSYVPREVKPLCKDLKTSYAKLEEVIKEHNDLQERILAVESERLTLEKQVLQTFIVKKKYLPITELKQFDGKYIAEISFITNGGESYDLETYYGVKVDNEFIEPLDIGEKNKFFIYSGDILYIGDKILPENEVIGFYNVWLLDLDAYERENGFAFDETQSEPIDKDYEVFIEETSIKELI